uniref:Ribosomal_L18e/L15P domain-containing protein n=1 Tax=Macrostomum lignano TaxID=282301 RepID=A0A1I8FM58_9PLAT
AGRLTVPAPILLFQNSAISKLRVNGRAGVGKPVAAGLSMAATASSSAAAATPIECIKPIFRRAYKALKGGGRALIVRFSKPSSADAKKA